MVIFQGWLMRNKFILVVILIVMIVVAVAFWLTAAIPQDLNYHDFSDKRSFHIMPNYVNVLSNLPFLLVGLLGLYQLIYAKNGPWLAELKAAYLIFFAGVTLVAFGSGYYHLWPSNETLVWDRLPMTIAFMALFSIIIGEFVSVKNSQALLWGLLLFGAFSVLYWWATERENVGDLRFYIVVQFLPMLIIPFVLWFFNSKYTHVWGYWCLMAAYGAAKALEFFDALFYKNFVIVSGHSCKHVIAAIGVYCLLRSYRLRRLSVE